MPEPFCFHREGFRGSASLGTISLPTVHFGSISMSRVRYAEGECICLLLDEDAHFLSRKDVHESGVCANMRIYMRIEQRSSQLCPLREARRSSLFTLCTR